MTKQHNNSDKSSGYFPQAGRWLWKLFSSAKLAIILILIIICLSIIGIFTSPDLFGSWFFIVPGSMLMLNVLICSINRWKGIRKVLKGRSVIQSESFFSEKDKATGVLDLSNTSQQIIESIKEILQKRHYRVREEKSGTDTYLAADKNRFFILGTYLSHLSIILLMLASILGSTLGFRESSFIVVEGETKEVGYDTDLSLNLISFTDSYYDDGTPSDYRSEVVIYKDGVEVTQTTIKVNHPFTYEGIRFYQSFFGPAAAIEITKNGETLYSENISLYGNFESYGYYRNIGLIDIDESKLSLAIITPSFNTPDPMIPKGQLAVLAYKDGKELGVHILEKTVPLEIDDVVLTYLSDAQYSGFQVKNDPANALVWIAFTLFIVGLVMVFYFPHSQISLLIKNTHTGNNKLFVRVMTSRAFNNTTTLKELISEVENKLTTDNNTKQEVHHG